MNYNAWLIGLYFSKSLSSVLGAMFGEKNDDVEPYFKQPIEELNSTYVPKTKKEIIEEKDTKFNTQYNFWAKLGKKRKGEN